jgi:DNA-binding HxlR family transcriptional regulator
MIEALSYAGGWEIAQELKRGPLRYNEIEKRTRLKHGNMYYIMPRLIKAGLVVYDHGYCLTPAAQDLLVRLEAFDGVKH